jgi:hypothetical protein
MGLQNRRRASMWCDSRMELLSVPSQGHAQRHQDLSTTAVAKLGPRDGDVVQERAEEERTSGDSGGVDSGPTVAR